MIHFNDESLYLKGTCDITLSDTTNSVIYFQSTKVQTGSINITATLEDIRAGIGHSIAAALTSDTDIAVEFDVAEFSLWAKGAHLGSTISYGAPVPRCQIITANDYSISLNTEYGVPASKLGNESPVCYVQRVGEKSRILSDGIGYPVNYDGSIQGFVSEPGVTYKVWYDVQNASAEAMAIKSLTNPKMVRMDVKMAVYTRANANPNSGTRVGWLYVSVPYLKLQAQSSLNGDQSSHDVSKIVGKAVSRKATQISSLSTAAAEDDLAYYVYAPDNEAASIEGIVVVGGLVQIPEGESAQIPVYFVMGDKSLSKPPNLETGFTYSVPEEASDYIKVSSSGVIQAISGGVDGYDTEITITYTGSDGEQWSCPVNIRVTDPKRAYSNIVGSGLVGYMVIA